MILLIKENTQAHFYLTFNFLNFLDISDDSRFSNKQLNDYAFYIIHQLLNRICF